jgi:hypothetical protein
MTLEDLIKHQALKAHVHAHQSLEKTKAQFHSAPSPEKKYLAKFTLGSYWRSL